MKKVFLGAFLTFLSIATLNAQTATADEIKAEKEALKSELKSEAYQKRQQKLAELKVPGAVGIASIDGIVATSAVSLASIVKLNEDVPELYKRTIGETIDGVTDVTVKKPSLDELLAVAGSITTLVAGTLATAQQIPGVAGDVSSAGPMKAIKALKSVTFIKDANVLVVDQLKSQGKIISSLIKVLKSSNNL
jgi:hypothetical protein